MSAFTDWKESRIIGGFANQPIVEEMIKSAMGFSFERAAEIAESWTGVDTAEAIRKEIES